MRLDDAVESEEIFATLIGENVEARRKFIEENAPYLKNLQPGPAKLPVVFPAQRESGAGPAGIPKQPHLAVSGLA